VGWRRSPIHRLIVAAFVASLILAVTIVIAVTVGYQQPDSLWLAELRLNECPLPCWNGIVPGQTTFADARQRVEETYGNADNYLVEEIIDRPGIFWFRVTNRGTGYSLVVVVRTRARSTSEQGLVQAIIVDPLIEGRSNLRPPLLADLHSRLGNVEGVFIGDEGRGLVPELFFKDYQVGVTVRLLPCQEVTLGQEIGVIFLYDSTFLEDHDWFSEEILQWRGFGPCYEKGQPIAFRS